MKTTTTHYCHNCRAFVLVGSPIQCPCCGRTDSLGPARIAPSPKPPRRLHIPRWLKVWSLIAAAHLATYAALAALIGGAP